MIYELISVIGGLAALSGVWAAGAKLVALSLRRGRGISVIIPFRASHDIQRIKNVLWLLQYWRKTFPGAEVIIGKDSDVDQPFSKSVAVNDGVAKSKGDILVVVDADGYIAADSVLLCTKEIRDARKHGQKLWFIPYRKFYRLTQAASGRLLKSLPEKPLEFPDPMPQESILGGDADPTVGHWFGAMIQIFPREAFDIVGGWDERFRGWGNEDHAAMRAMDTLYSPHKTLPGRVLHVWHPQIGPQGEQAQVHWKERMWVGQDAPGVNDQLGDRYYGAYRNPERMRKLVDEWKEHCHKHHDHHKHHEHHHRHHHRRSM